MIKKISLFLVFIFICFQAEASGFDIKGSKECNFLNYVFYPDIKKPDDFYRKLNNAKNQCIKKNKKRPDKYDELLLAIHQYHFENENKYASGLVEKYFSPSAKKFHPQQYVYLGKLLNNGELFKIDKKLACDNWQKAYELGAINALRNLDSCYRYGILNFDIEKANELTKTASDFGYKLSSNTLGIYYYSTGNYREAIKFFNLSFKQGWKESLGGLVLTYLKLSEENDGYIKDAIKHLNQISLIENLNQSYQIGIDEEKAYLKVHLPKSNLKNKILKHYPDFSFEREKYLKRLEKIVSFNSGILALNDIVDDEFYSVVELEEFQPVLSQIEQTISNNTDLTTKIRGSWFLYNFYINGLLGPADNQKGLSFLKNAADLGDAAAALEYGYISMKYAITEKQTAEVFKYFKLAAELADNDYLKITSLNNLALVSLNKNDFSEAEKSLTQAAELAHKSKLNEPLPAINLLYFYLADKYRDLKEAKKYANYAVEENSNSILLEAFKKIEENPNLSLESFLLNNLDNFDGYHHLAKMYLFRGNLEEAYAFLSICSNQFIHNVARKKCNIMKEGIEGQSPKPQILKFKKYAYNKEQEIKSLIANAKSISVKEKANILGNNYALLISNWNYDNLTDLKSPPNDTKVIKDILAENYNYSVQLISNASRREIITSLNNYKKSLNPEDNLIVYYAGHGKSEGNTSFWLPKEALPNDDTDWIDDSTIERKIGQIKAKNILVIADSCFSGNLTRGVDIVSVDTNEEVLNTYRNTVSRVAITSGGDEPILDKGPSGHSIFAAALIDYLKSQKNGFTAQELSLGISDRVLRTSIEYGLKQTPGYGQLFNAGHVGLDFVFIPKK